LRVFKLETVTFWLYELCSTNLSADEQTAFLLGAEVLPRDFYVTDVISGVKSKEKAVIIMDQTSKILDK